MHKYPIHKNKIDEEMEEGGEREARREGEST
jgi:hypothetical protein